MDATAVPRPSAGRRRALESPQGGTVGGKPVTVTIGEVTAHCPRCGCMQFRRAFRLDKVEMLACADCGSEHLRGFLIDQVTNEAILKIEGTLRVARQQKHERLVRRLNAAIAEAGGVDALALRLDVDPRRIDEWLEGIVSPPEAVAETLIRLTPDVS
jgi:Zn ribbon nucleic-acid-binding protein